MGRFAALLLLGLGLAACSDAPPSDLDFRVVLESQLAQGGLADDDSRCIGHAVVDQDGGGDFLRDLYDRADGDPANLPLDELAEVGAELIERLTDAATVCNLDPGEVLDALGS
jgi:hypothetical protein